MSKQITILLVFRFEGRGPKWKGFSMMQWGHKALNNALGLKFYKLMGVGRGNGFNPWPDFSRYAWISIWDDLELFRKFMAKSDYFKGIQEVSKEIDYFELRTIRSHGSWSGKNPWKSINNIQTKGNIAVLTRASIKLKYLRRFWKYVPQSSRSLLENQTLKYSVGVGELPLTQMATFSIWESLDDLKEYAYKKEEHKEAIKRTRQLNWYKEELFARFEVLNMQKIK